LSLKKELKPLQSLAVSAISLSKRVQNKCFYFETPNKNKVYFKVYFPANNKGLKECVLRGEKSLKNDSCK